MRESRPFLGTLLWLVAGAAIGALLFFAHYLVFHDSTDEVDEHAGSEVRQ